VSIGAKLRWGILGVANINNRLVPAFAGAAHAELRAIASRSPDKARAAAAAAGIPTAHGSYEALLDDPDIDAVYIPLPNTLHAEWTRRAADRGKHVLCEKPLTPTAPEAEEVIAYCRGKNVQLMDGFMWPHHPRTARLRQLLDAGGIGEVQRVSAAFTFPLEPFDPNNIRLRTELAGGSLLDVGCYPVYGIRWAFGAEPEAVYATARYEYGVDVEMTGVVRLADGRMGSFDCGFTLPFRGWMEITGTEATVFVPNLWLPGPRANFMIHREGRDSEEIFIEGEDQIARMINHFSTAVLEGKPVTPAPEEAVRTLRVLDALAESAREGGEVKV
jgi:predicted dehydrogenase